MQDFWHYLNNTEYLLATLLFCAVFLKCTARAAAAEISLRTRILLEFGRVVPLGMIEPAVTKAGELYALGYHEDNAGPFLVTVQRDLTYDHSHKLKLDLYAPQFAPSPLPAVILIHGGGWKYFNKSATSGYARFLASHGFAAVSVDYRLQTEAKWPAQLDDLRTALLWITENNLKLNIDPHHIATLGDSAGGHLAAMLGLTCNDPQGPQIAAVIAYYGVYDMSALLSRDHLARENPINQLLGDASDIEQTARDASPITHVHPGAPPFFLVHGTADSVVPVEQTKALAAALKDAGVPAQTLYVKGADHLLLGLSGPIDPPLVVTDNQVLSFLRRYLWRTTVT
ncbi:MAG TPA: alpha/beta hydrolase [Firmicutes bacterium]|jgi:acetyl esterase/lipase|nr:alpha/beta hydrolase [Bacillota bacterium]